jgi:hypothetical protein
VKYLLNLLFIITPVFWMTFVCYLFWYLTSAAHNVFLSRIDASALWKIHKGNQQCKGKKWKSITQKQGKIIGFECSCGYSYTQKKLVLSSSPRISSQLIYNKHILSRI